MDAPHSFSRILFECTPTMRSPSLRGIPRVVQGIVRNAGKVAPEYGIETLPIAYGNNGWNEATGVGDAAMSNGDQLSPLTKAVAETVCNVLPAKKLRSLLLPSPGRNGIWKLPRKMKRKARLIRQKFATRKVQPTAGDVVVFIDPWLLAPDGYWRNIEKARQRGARLCTVVHDLIPLTHPYLVSERHREKFANWFRQVTNHSDCFAAVSETIKIELQAYLREHFPERPWVDEQFSSFKHGAHLTGSTTGDIPEQIVQAFADDNTYLMVGAIEPRKNQMFLLDAFEHLWQRGADVKLCFVGNTARGDLGQRLQSHPECNKRLFHFSGVSDAVLNYCYQRSAALVFPSVVEGFGLPIVEALQHGKLVFASDTPIHREVGGDFCWFFDLQSTDSLVTILEAFERNGRHINVRPATEYVPSTWEGACRNLFDALCPKAKEPPHVADAA